MAIRINHESSSERKSVSQAGHKIHWQGSAAGRHHDNSQQDDEKTDGPRMGHSANTRHFNDLRGIQHRRLRRNIRANSATLSRSSVGANAVNIVSMSTKHIAQILKNDLGVE